MTTVKHILQAKGNAVWSVDPEDTILTALKMMAEKNAGALMVMSGSSLVGVFSERDYARRGILQDHGPETPVREVMTPLVYYVKPEQPLEEIIALMAEKRIRHLPVVENNQIVGVISIGDVVNKLIEDQKYQISGLQNYILGGQFAL